MSATDLRPLRLMVYDETCRGTGLLPGLSDTFAVGAKLWGVLDRFEASFGAKTWAEALEWIATVEPSRQIAEIQFWGHGHFGCALIAHDSLDIAALQPGDPRLPQLERIRDRLIPSGQAMWWFRTCETFGTARGHAFARAWSRFFGCKVAGHTYVIWIAQSGLHVLEPGAEPDWPEDEGLHPEPASSEGTPKARWSGFLQPNTISFLGNDPKKG